MKQRKPVTKQRKGAGLRESAERGKRWHDPLAELAKMYKPLKKPVTLRLDADVLAWFKRPGRGYQTRINRALRELMLQGRKKAAKGEAS
jgi:uncharacterized protein (DUF4415 family)